MCVTNTTNKRPVTLSAQAATSPSILSQRLCKSLFLGVTLPSPTYETLTVVSTEAHTETTKDAKQRTKRRRKPQKPGKTAKMNDRHFVVHKYHDHLNDGDEPELEPKKVESKPRRRGGVNVSFPQKLHSLLDRIEADGLAHVISWQPHGRAFVVHKPKEFVNHVMPEYFRQTKLTSFQRQLNLYGFARLTKGPDNGGYYHELFLRGKVFLCKRMMRTKVKGTGFKAASSPDQEPDFYRMPPVLVSPHQSSEDSNEDEEDDDMSILSNSTIGSAPYETRPHFNPIHPSSMEISMPMSPVHYFTSLELASPKRQQEQCIIPTDMPLTVSVAELVSESSISSDDVLDGVVDELFLQEPIGDENDTILDFVKTWNPDRNSFLEATGYDDFDSIEDDAQLGRLIEKMLGD